jgi:archaellum component FlaC
MQSALLDVPDAGFANIWKVGCEIERELNTAQERIKRLDETLEAVTDKIDNAWGIYMKFKEAKP